MVLRRRLSSFVLAGSLCSSVASARAPTVAPRVLAEYPHDASAFTQGLVHHEGSFYESTGLRGRSSLRRVTPKTGIVELDVDLGADEFGEGLARVGDRLIQLTWQERVAHVYRLDTFEPVGDHAYEGEGWGLCFDGQKLVMTDGSDQLFFRDPESFDLLGSQHVTDDGVPVEELNELECADGLVLANVWQTDNIVVIDPSTGHVLERVDARGLLTTQEAASADVLNGIARDDTSGHFYLTGKLWPTVFEVELELPARVPAEPAPSTTTATTTTTTTATTTTSATATGGEKPAENGGTHGRGGSCAMCALGRRGDATLVGVGWLLLVLSIVWRRLSQAGARFLVE